MNYQELVDKCKKAYADRNLELADKYWCEIFDVLDKKLKNNEEDKFNIYQEFHTYMEQFTDNEVYAITDYGRRKAYLKMGIVRF